MAAGSMMSSLSLSQRQIARVKNEAELSLANARSLRDQWAIASSQNPTGLTQREIEQLGKAFQNRLLTVKWDCEDLEELVSGDGDKHAGDNAELAAARLFIAACRDEIVRCTRQLDEYEANKKVFSKHGIEPSLNQTGATRSTLPMAAQAVGPAVASIIQNPLHNSPHYQKLEEAEPAGSELAHFDKRQIEASTTIFNNALYEHFEEEDALTKSINATKVFNNLTRPTAEDIRVGSNENEMILEMLDTEYYKPPPGLLAKAKQGVALRGLFDLERNKFVSTIALLFSFPILLILFLVI